MKTINLLTPFKEKLFSRQIPNTANGLSFEFFENGVTSSSYDFVVVYEGISSPTTINCPKGNLIFISGEPPISNRYSREFLAQFDHVISSHPKIPHPNNHLSQQSLPWHFGFDSVNRRFKYNFEDLVNLPMPLKQKKMSIVSSGKSIMPGHKKRALFVRALQHSFSDSIDFFGRDSYQIDDKSGAILPYYMSICIENSTINNYWTEKLADAFLGFSLPIYHGCTNITGYFSEQSMFILNINNTKEALYKIEWLLQNCESIYKDRLPYIMEARNLVLHHYNILPSLVEFYTNKNLHLNIQPNIRQLQPNNTFSDYKYNLQLLKIERYVKKLLA